jgi:hypothetical protein
VTITSTLSRTNSVAISANRSLRPSAQRYSIAMVRPSIQPSSRSRCTKAASRWLQLKAVDAPKKPMMGCFVDCCAPTASGHGATDKGDEFPSPHGALEAEDYTLPHP